MKWSTWVSCFAISIIWARTIPVNMIEKLRLHIEIDHTSHAISPGCGSMKNMMETSYLNINVSEWNSFWNLQWLFVVFSFSFQYTKLIHHIEDPATDNRAVTKSSSSTWIGMFPSLQLKLPSIINCVKNVSHIHNDEGMIFLQNSICFNTFSDVWFFWFLRWLMVSVSMSLHKHFNHVLVFIIL